jgi:elongation factor Ts
MAISASQVNDLRKKTGAGMMDCKKALTEADGDIEKAIEILRKKGAAVAAKRADRAANEGIVLTKVADDKRSAVIVEINCETDFVANSDDFKKFGDDVLATVWELKTRTVEELYEKKPQLKSDLESLMAKIGEKTEVSRIAVLSGDSAMIDDYVHPGAKLGVLVQCDNVADEMIDELKPIIHDISMQVAAMSPIAVSRDEVDKEVINKELEIYKEIAKKEGKPDNILDRIAEGKLNKFFEENCLLDQTYVKDNAKKVKDLIKEFNDKNDTNVEVKLFIRYHLGDEGK